MTYATLLPHRSLIRISGADRHAFLQGLISNDVAKITENQAIYAALLTPQGKFLHDLFILAQGESFLIDCESARAEDLVRRLMAYKLRSKVAFENLADVFDVCAVWNDAYAAPLAFPDPRLPEFGARIFMEKSKVPVNVTLTDFSSYDRHRLMLGVADGSRDLEIEKSTLAEGNFDFLNGVDWKKGCYIGQELTARMHYRALAKKRLFPVKIEGTTPNFGAPIGESGEMRSSCGDYGLAVLKIEDATQAMARKQALTCGDSRLVPTIPQWVKL